MQLLTLLLHLLAVAGCALILTRSSLFAPLREGLARSAEAGPTGRAWHRRTAALGLLAKLVSCPMCSGFWFGIAWGLLLGAHGLEVLALGPAGSLAAALGVGLWSLLGEAQSALELWRYLRGPQA